MFERVHVSTVVCCVHVSGERVCSLFAEDMYLLPVVFGEVPQLSQPGNEGVMKVPPSSSSLPAPPLTPDCAIYPECICSDSDQQHQFLHVCT